MVDQLGRGKWRRETYRGGGEGRAFEGRIMMHPVSQYGSIANALLCQIHSSHGSSAPNKQAGLHGTHADGPESIHRGGGPSLADL